MLQARQKGPTQVIDWLRYAVIAAGVLVAVCAYAGWRRNTSPGRVCLAVAVVAELLVIVQAVVVTAKLIGGHHLAEPATFIGYLVTLVIVLPVAWWWSRLEKSKWGAVVVLVCGLVVAVLTVRLDQVWVATA